MITISIDEAEKNARELIIKLLKNEGYGISADPVTGAIAISGRGTGPWTTALEQKVYEITRELYMQRRGDIYSSIVTQVERSLIGCALEMSEGNQLKAARALGINRNTMRAKIRKHGVDASTWKIE